MPTDKVLNGDSNSGEREKVNLYAWTQLNLRLAKWEQ